ncbi:hypothetical protein FRC10_003546 [Ceratobasidium sp. 414]|nr:hypothetical protein FRC10_003546 [Ceratobasidium sp. 414]
MANIRPGPHNIFLDEQQCLGVDSPMGDFVVLLPRSVAPGKILWHVDLNGDGTITLKNLETGKYAGTRGTPEENEPVMAMDRPLEFRPIPGREIGKFKLLVAKAENLALGQSLNLPMPPRTALRPSGDAPEWRFQPLE